MIIEEICSICGEKFTVETNNYENVWNAKNSLTKKLKLHIKNTHNISIKDYIVNKYYNGIEPTCACGCGEKLKFHEKNCFYSEMHGFAKYTNCGHVARNNDRIIEKNKEAYKSKWECKDWRTEHYDNEYGIENIKNALNDFLNNSEYTNYDITKKYGIDIRTLKNIWLKLDLVSKDKLIERGLFNKYNVSKKHRFNNFENKDEICEKLHSMLINNPLKYTFRTLIDTFNDTNLLQINTRGDIVLNSLVEKYGETIYEYLLFGYHSKEELEFVRIVKYYFGRKSVTVGKKIRYGVNDRQVYIYDICIDNKLIIEYDSTGYYHDNKKRDLDKENFALNLGYKFLRISHKTVKEIDILLQIKTLLEND